MKVDFNNVRKILISEYSDLCFLLNNSVKENGRIVINPKEIKSHMDSLRLCVSIIAATSIDGREEFQPVGESELPIFEITK